MFFRALLLVSLAGLFWPQVLAGDTGAHPDLPEIDGFPSQPLRLVVYTSPGGLIDVTARRFARLAQEHADHPVAVINRPGGGGIVAFDEVLSEPADGHRFLAVTRSNISRMVASGREDLIDRIRWQAYIMDNAHVLITNAEAGPRDYAELVETRHNGNNHQLWLGVDIGGVKHVSGVKMADKAGINMHWIPYGSGGEAVAALLGNLGTAYLGNPRDALASDKLRVVAVAAQSRLPDFPEAPTFAELGVDGLEDELIWRGFALPRDVSEDIAQWYDALIKRVINDPRWLSAWDGEAVTLRHHGRERFTEIVEADRDEFRAYLEPLGMLPTNDEADGLLQALTRGPGLNGVVSIAGLLLIGLAVTLPRTRWRVRHSELLLLSAIAVGSLLLWLISLLLPPANPVDPIGSGGIPRLWLLLLLLLAIWQISRCLREPAPTMYQAHTRTLLGALGLFVAYLLLVPVLGYLLASALYLPALIWVLGYRRIPVIAILVVAWLLVSEFIFQRLLQVDLPAGLLF